MGKKQQQQQYQQHFADTCSIGAALPCLIIVLMSYKFNLGLGDSLKLNCKCV